MKYCKSCGQPLANDARFCSSCGAEFFRENLEDQTQNEQAMTPIETKTENSPFDFFCETLIENKKAQIISVICLVLVVFGPAAYFCLKGTLAPNTNVSPAYEEETPEPASSAVAEIDYSQYALLSPTELVSTFAGTDRTGICGVYGVALVAEYDTMTEQYCITLTDGDESIMAFYDTDVDCVEDIRSIREGDIIACYGTSANNIYGSTNLIQCFGVTLSGDNYYDDMEAEANDLSNYLYVTLDDLCYYGLNNTDLYMSNNYYGHYLAVGGLVNDVYMTDDGEYCVYLATSRQDKYAYDYLKAYFPADTQYANEISNLYSGTWVVCYGKLTGTDYGLTFELRNCVSLENSNGNITGGDYDPLDGLPTVDFGGLDFASDFIDAYGSEAIAVFCQNYGFGYNSGWDAYTDAEETVFTDCSTSIHIRSRSDYSICGVSPGIELAEGYRIAQQYGCTLSEWSDDCIDFCAEYNGYEIYYETEAYADSTIRQIYIYKQA